MNMFLELFARRYIAGDTIEDAVNAVANLNSHGILASIDNLGEMVKLPELARRGVKEYLRLLDAIEERGIRADISLKLTHMGLDIEEGLCRENLERVIKRAEDRDNFVWFDMESSRYTEMTIDIFMRLHERYKNIGIAIQSCLKRSSKDIARLMDTGARVRLVKGAYREPPEIAIQKKSDVDRNFEEIMKKLLIYGNRPAIATHDERLIDKAILFAGEMDTPKERFEFQMLMGIKRSLQKRLAGDGYLVRVYVPYGPEWLPYTIRRFRERKENLFFFIKNIFD